MKLNEAKTLPQLEAAARTCHARASQATRVNVALCPIPGCTHYQVIATASSPSDAWEALAAHLFEMHGDVIPISPESTERNSR